MDINTVLNETRPVTAWADEVEIDERGKWLLENVNCVTLWSALVPLSLFYLNFVDLQIAAARKSALPTAPRSARGTDDERVPNAPPYVAYITNIPFEVIEEDIAEFFADMQV